MRAVVLGSGGSQPTPKVGCMCRVCRRARADGGKNVRTGPSLWLPEHGVLVDTPEESNAQLNREGIEIVNALLWSHFHPDHTAGLRIVEFLARWGAPSVPTYLSEDLETSLEGVSLFSFARRMNHIEVGRFLDGIPFYVGALEVIPLRHVGEPPVYSYRFSDGHARMLYTADHFQTLDLTTLKPTLERLDLAVIQVGLIPEHVLPLPLPMDHPARRVLLPLETILERARLFGWRRVVFTHLYEAIRLYPEEYDALALELSLQFGLEVGFAWDGMILEISA